jgi:hypothetical protein
MSLKLPNGRKLQDEPAMLEEFKAHQAMVDALRAAQGGAIATASLTGTAPSSAAALQTP